MPPPSIHELASWLADPSGRAEAAARIASMLGVAAFVILLRDPEIGAPRPAPGFPQTLPGGPTWTKLLARAAAGGEFTTEIAFPDRQTLTTAHVFAAGDGAVFLLIGGEPTISPTEFGQVPLLSALLYAELAQSSAKGVAKAAQDATQRSTMLATALDGARNEIERKAAELSAALAEADRLNAELRELNNTLEQRVAAEVAERTKTEEALQQSQKMEAVGQLVSGLAHDFNNLLGAVVGSLDLIRRRADDPERVRRFAEAGLQAAERGSKLTGQLLTFSRTQRIELKPLLVCDMIEGVRNMLARTLGPMIELEFDLNPCPVPVLADATQVEMTILNLAINARDAMPEGGTLRIATATRRIEADPELAPGDYVEVTVTDTGIGMDAATLQRAMDPFFTTKPIGKGTGLGLAQVYGSAHQSGGTVRLESAPGQGTTVRVLLPRTDRAAQEALITGTSTVRLRPHATVLIVDDDADLRGVLVHSLDTLGYKVVEASDGPSGLHLLKEQRPDVMVVDFAMPGMNGAEVAKVARERCPDLPIVLTSGYANSDAIERAIGKDAKVLRKPFRIDELLSVVGEALKDT